MKKKIVAGLLVLGVVFSISGCGGQSKEYKQAVEAIQQTELKLDGSNEMSKDILLALENAKYTEAKNIIFMIGDGMGYNIIEATQTVYADKLYEGTLAINQLPIQSAQTTYSINSYITDSAAGGTALATGYKTKNAVLALDMITQKKYQTTLELAASMGKSTGVVVTDEISEATPASFTAHTNGRGKKEDIAKQQLQLMIDGDLDLAFGGGRTYFEADVNSGVLEKAKKVGVTYSTNWEEASKAELPMIGSFAESRLDTTDQQTPSLATMTDFALRKLSENEEGFFLMVEGAQIDDYAEFNELDAEMREMYEFDCAIAVAMRYVALNPDTVLIITADHDTGDLEFPVDATAEEIKSQATYGTDWHIYKSVPLIAVGYRTEELKELQENTDVGAFVASLLGEKEFGAKSKRHTLWKAKDKKGKSVELDESQSEYIFSLETHQETTEKVVDLRIVSVMVKNPTTETVELPNLEFEYRKKSYTIKPDRSYLKAGETMTIGYVIPDDAWEKNILQHITELVFTTNGKHTTLELLEVGLTERSGTK